jgi:Phenylalanyl-tRNA synthetase alpha subunit
MSGPNKSYDPVEVSALDPAALEAAVTEALTAFAAADSLQSLKTARLAHQGDASALSLANREIGALPPTAKAEAGKRVGMARGRVARALAERQNELEVERDARLLVEEAVDVTAPVAHRRLGARHPLELISERIGDIFVAMGWEIAEGPEVESEWFNFDALNLGVDHPARQMQDTFFVDPPDAGLVLRTHTSPVQVRSMLERDLPLYIVCPGKVFRTDELDATHSAVFHQVEGLAVAEGLTMAHLARHPRPLRRGALREESRDATSAVILPLHRAQRRARLPVLHLRRLGRALPHLWWHRMDRVGWLRDGQP